MATDRRLLQLMELAKANQIVREERAQNMEAALSDLDATVQGIWKGLNRDGSGNVSYRGKSYVVVPEGKTSIPAGTKVNLMFRKNHYVATW